MKHCCKNNLRCFGINSIMAAVYCYGCNVFFVAISFFTSSCLPFIEVNFFKILLKNNSLIKLFKINNTMNMVLH